MTLFDGHGALILDDGSCWYVAERHRASIRERWTMSRNVWRHTRDASPWTKFRVSLTIVGHALKPSTTACYYRKAHDGDSPG